jgi:uncharacterized membrane protein
MSTTPDKLVERYLKHLEVELDDLPRARRQEIVDEIAGHIAEARAGLEHETEADVRNILDGLGDPAEIAADARERFDVGTTAPAVPFKPGAVEIGALIMLLVGSVVLPLIGWLIGVILLWTSNAWNVRDKIIGTLFPPGGLGLVIGAMFLSFSAEGGSCVGDVFTGTGQPQPVECTDSGGASYLGIVALTILLVMPVLTTAYLAYRLRQHTVAATA